MQFTIVNCKNDIYLFRLMCRQVWADIQIVFQVNVTRFEDQQILKENLSFSLNYVRS